ncbi:glycoside hydrolase family 15 protein [Blastomonas fulva]|jgi:GH15 family glucan-1,4-alpha-glucosidase|uniref:glycoside hydrolase family 15 protein n=1 Tax=Blastomonas fulva TaxID=1550728 RepID=UPI003D2B6EF7
MSTAPDTADVKSDAMNLWPIGNCEIAALIDSKASIRWGCLPRFDGDPVFCSLLEPEKDHGFWDVLLEGCTRIEQHYVRNTPVLVTRMSADCGNVIEIVDFMPRYQRHGRMFRPVAIARIIRVISGSPRIAVRLRPAHSWGAQTPAQTSGSNHIRYILDDLTQRLTCNAPLGWIRNETMFRVESDLHFYFGPDEGFDADLAATLEAMLEQTVSTWQHWVRGLHLPLEWQDAVIRAAITLKLCQYEQTGAIVAALTTSLPEHANSGRNWDYRFCWIRDAYFTVQALNRLGALDVLESYLHYLRNIVDAARGGHIQPLYGIGGEAQIEEHIMPALKGYKGMGPVRSGNQAYEQIQHDAYGQIILSSVQAFFDQRLLRRATVQDFEALEAVGHRAFDVFDTPDAGLWELRTRSHIHTYSVAMCWAACDRLANAANAIGRIEASKFWQDRADHIRQHIDDHAWSEEGDHYSAVFGERTLDASLLQLLDLKFVQADDPRFITTLAAIEAGLRRGSHMLRYAEEDDFGMPETAFNVCTFWLIEALHATGRDADARVLFEEMLSRRTPAGLLSEDIDPRTGALWGNYPQTYSLVGLIQCAGMLSRPWSDAR